MIRLFLNVVLDFCVLRELVFEGFGGRNTETPTDTLTFDKQVSEISFGRFSYVSHKCSTADSRFKL